MTTTRTAPAVKTKVTLWTSEATARSLRDLASQTGVSVSEAGAEILQHALTARSAGLATDLLAPRLEQLVRREISRMSDRVAAVLVRDALESAATRRLVLQLLAREAGVDGARELNDAAWRASVDALRRPAGDLVELLGLTRQPQMPPEDGCAS